MGVLKRRALLFGVKSRAPDFSKLHCIPQGTKLAMPSPGEIVTFLEEGELTSDAGLDQQQEDGVDEDGPNPSTLRTQRTIDLDTGIDALADGGRGPVELEPET